MATDKPRFSITLDAELYEKINDYQHAKKFATQTKAITDLIMRGAKALGLVIDDDSAIDAPEVVLSDAERDMILAYRQADARARQMVSLALEPWAPPADIEEAI